MTTVKEGGVQVGGADIVTLDFGAGFDITEGPDTEINIAIDLSEGSVGTLPVASGGTGVTALPTRPIILSALSGTPAAISVPTPRAACSWPILVVGTYEAYWVLDFDTTTIEVATWEIVMPPDYNGGTITFTPYWTTASTNTGTVIWSLSALAKGDNETLDAAAGAAQTSTDSGLGTAGKEHIGPTSAAITIAGTPAAGVTVAFVLMRNTSDTHTADARLRFIKINYTASAF